MNIIDKAGNKGGTCLLLVRRKENTEENSIKLVAYTIILFLSSFFAPLVVVASYQSMVYSSRAQWFFSTPISSYITFMGGMIYIAVVLTFYIIFRNRWEGSRVKWITGMLLLISLPAFIFSLTNYYYLDDDGIHYNSLLSLKETEYKWGEIKKVHIVYRNYQGTTDLYQYKFEMGDGSQVTIPFNDKLSEHKYQVQEIIKENNIPIKDNYNNPIAD
jgi:hypothetical protein